MDGFGVELDRRSQPKTAIVVSICERDMPSFVYTRWLSPVVLVRWKAGPRLNITAGQKYVFV